MDIRPKIAICIPTILKDDVLMKCINSILDVYQENWIILIGEQNEIDTYSEEKKIFYLTACAREHDNLHQDKIKVVKLPYDCGLSYARNRLVEKAHELGIDYCLISADSIVFTESMKNLTKMLEFITPNDYYDLLGLELNGRISWEAKLDKTEGWEFNFIDRTKEGLIYDCDIVRNFFLATTKSLLACSWDNEAKMAEHTDFFWRYKQKGYKVGFTNLCAGKYLSSQDNREYQRLRRKNMEEGKKYIMKKYNLKKWHIYKHLERIKK